MTKRGLIQTWVAILSACLLLTASGFAQKGKAPSKRDEVPKWEIGGIVSYTADNPGYTNEVQIHGHGFGIRGTRNLNDWLGLEVQGVLNPANGADAWQLSIGTKFTPIRGFGNRSFLSKLNWLGYSRGGGFRNFASRSGFFSEFSPALEFGTGIEFCTSRKQSIRFDIGDYVIVPSARWGDRLHHLDMKIAYTYRF